MIARLRKLLAAVVLCSLVALAWASGCSVHRTVLPAHGGLNRHEGLQNGPLRGHESPGSPRSLDSYSECVKRNPANPNACGGRDPEVGPARPSPDVKPRPKTGPGTGTPRKPPKPPPPPPPPDPPCRLMGQGGGSTWSRPKKCFYECPPGKRPQICKYVRGYQVPCPDGPRGDDIPFAEIKDLDDCD